MDISKFKELLGLGVDNSDDLEAAMEKQIIPEVQHGRRATDRRGAAGDKANLHAEAVGDKAGNLPANGQLMKAGRCPSCGDQIVTQAEQPCAWCAQPCRPDQDGFHLVHIALGTFQERHCFCSDDCFEAFRRMYPARVHRNCYERLCADCHYCIKRFVDESDGFRGQAHSARARNAVTPEKD